MILPIEIVYNIGEKVYLITDTEQSPRLVTGISVRRTSTIYELSKGSDCSSHYDFEISKEPNFILKSES